MVLCIMDNIMTYATIGEVSERLGVRADGGNCRDKTDGVLHGDLTKFVEVDLWVGVNSER